MSRQLLIRASNWIGDCIMSVAAVKELRRLYPEDRLTIIGYRRLTGLSRDRPSSTGSLPWNLLEDGAGFVWRAGRCKARIGSSSSLTPSLQPFPLSWLEFRTDLDTEQTAAPCC